MVADTDHGPREVEDIDPDPKLKSHTYCVFILIICLKIRTCEYFIEKFMNSKKIKGKKECRGGC